MSDRELDHLFKSKLEELEKRPSAAAWDKIQSNVSTKNTSGKWLYSGIAAAIVILVAVGTALWVNRSTEQPVEQIAEKSQVGSTKSEDGRPESEGQSPKSEDRSPKTEVKAQENSSLTEKKALLALNNGSNSNKGTANTKHQTPNGELSSENSELRPENTELKTANTKQETVDTELRTINDATSETLTASTDQKPEANGQTLIFNIEDFNTSKAVAIADNMNEPDKKPSTLRKVLDFAKNVKEGDAGLGELREAKNELFALNFKKDDDSK